MTSNSYDLPQIKNSFQKSCLRQIPKVLKVSHKLKAARLHLCYYRIFPNRITGALDMTLGGASIVLNFCALGLNVPDSHQKGTNNHFPVYFPIKA